MKKFIVLPLKEREYDSFLVGLTRETVINYLLEIEKDPTIQNSSGCLLIDQGVAVGNSKWRFLRCEYNEGDINIYSFRDAISQEYYRNISAKIVEKFGEVVEAVTSEFKKKELAVE